MDLIQKSIGSTTELTFNALGSLKALNIFSHLYKGVRSLLLSPIKYGLVYCLRLNFSFMDLFMA